MDRNASEGLRTLMLAEKFVSAEELADFNSKLFQAQQLLRGREEALQQLYSEFETGLYVVGSVGIEDKLQDQVPETIEFIRQAGI